MSRVRYPCASTCSTAASIRSAKASSLKRVLEQHRHRQDSRQRVRHTCTGDVWGTPMHRLVQRRTIAQAGGGRQADRASDHGGLIAQDIAEQVPRDDDIELLGSAHQLHGGVIDVHVFIGHVWKVLGHLLDHLAPQPAGLEDVRLIHRGEATGALPGDLKRQAHDAIDLCCRIYHGVDTTFARGDGCDTTWLAVIDIAL